MTYWNVNNGSPAESNHRSAVRISSSRSQHHEQAAVTGCRQRLKDTDGDRIPDHLDPDDNEDGISDYLDADTDGDGSQDTDEKDHDTDGDGTPDVDDSDDDNDGTPDARRPGRRRRRHPRYGGEDDEGRRPDGRHEPRRRAGPSGLKRRQRLNSGPSRSGRQRRRNCRLPGTARFEQRRNTGQRGRRRRLRRNRRRRRSRPLHLLLLPQLCTVVCFGSELKM